MTSNTDGRPALSNELIEQFSLHGRTAVITGAAGGIGRQAAITFTQAGANVLIADVGIAGLEETAAMVAAAPPSCLLMFLIVIRSMHSPTPQLRHTAVSTFGQTLPASFAT
jgi:NAD(P)-dependent dehydrogenase (short-subunit alcohol dehydrogenase family)